MCMVQASGPKGALDFTEYRPVLEYVLGRIKESLKKHGDWQEYTPEQVFEVVASEFDEYREALVKGQLEGRHGQVDELLDVAATAVKGILALGRGL